MPQAASTATEAEWPADALDDRALGGLAVEPHLAAEEEVGVEVAEREVRVGHGRLRAAEPVGHRAGTRPRALRADEEPAERVDPRDRAAAGADLDHLDHRDLDREAAALLEVVAAVDLELRGDERLAVGDDARLGGGAAHVERQQVLVPEERAVVRGGEGAGRGPRLDQPDGVAAPGIGLAEPAVRLHDEEAAADAGPAQPLLEPPEVALGQPLDVHVGERRRRALVLADLGHELARERDRHVRERLPQDRPDEALMGRVRVGVEEADRRPPRRARLGGARPGAGPPPGSTGRRAVPSTSMRSSTSNRRWRGAIGRGRCM